RQRSLRNVLAAGGRGRDGRSRPVCSPVSGVHGRVPRFRIGRGGLSFMSTPRIRTTAVGSYPIPDWLAALPSDQGRTDAMRVVFDIQRQSGVDLPTDGELYRFDVNHPDTNGMIDYFVWSMAGIRTRLARRA